MEQRRTTRTQSVWRESSATSRRWRSCRSASTGCSTTFRWRHHASSPLTWIDRSVPFWLWTIWAYFALIAMAAGLPLLVRNALVFRRLLVAYAISMGTAWAFFLLMPTHYPRPPLPEDDSFTRMSYRAAVGVRLAGVLLPVVARDRALAGLCRLAKGQEPRPLVASFGGVRGRVLPFDSYDQAALRVGFDGRDCGGDAGVVIERDQGDWLCNFSPVIPA